MSFSLHLLTRRHPSSESDFQFVSVVAMALIAQSVHYCMSRFWSEHGDARSRDYFMVRNGLYEPLGIIALYVLFVTQIGPRLMRHREPFDLRRPLIAYNFVMVALNSWFFVETVRNYTIYDIFDFDYPRADDYRPMTLKKIAMSHIYLLSKFLDLLDTIFLVLHKKRPSGLHLYHHSIVPILGFVAMRMVPSNGPLSIFAICNTLAHTFMYAYYGLSTLGPSVRPYLWWKKYVTLLQIYQFVIYSFFSWIFAFRQRGYPLSLQVLAYTQPIIFLILFCRFYINSYGGGGKRNFNVKSHSNNNDNKLLIYEKNK